MSRVNISSGWAMEAQMAYLGAVVVDDWVMVSGTTGYNYQTGEISDNIVEQAEQVLSNISSVLKKAVSSRKDVVNVVYILPGCKEFHKVWPVLQSWLGDVLSASMLFQATLYMDEMKIDMEVTAKKRCGRKDA